MRASSEKTRQRLLCNFFKKHPDMYKKLLELMKKGEEPTREDFEDMGEVIGMTGAAVKRRFLSIRFMRIKGSIDPPVDKNRKRRRITRIVTEKKYERELDGFKKNHPEIWKGLKALLETGGKLTDATKKNMLSADGTLKKKTLDTIFYMMRRFCEEDGSRDGTPPQPTSSSPNGARTPSPDIGESDDEDEEPESVNGEMVFEEPGEASSKQQNEKSAKRRREDSFENSGKGNRPHPTGSSMDSTAKRRQLEDEDVVSTSPRVLSEPAEHQADKTSSWSEDDETSISAEHEEPDNGTDHPYIDIEMSLYTLYNALDSANDDEIIEFANDLGFDLEKLKELIQSSKIPEQQTERGHYRSSDELFETIKHYSELLGSQLSQVPEEEKELMSDVLCLELSDVENVVKNKEIEPEDDPEYQPGSSTAHEPTADQLMASDTEERESNGQPEEQEERSPPPPRAQIVVYDTRRTDEELCASVPCLWPTPMLKQNGRQSEDAALRAVIHVLAMMEHVVAEVRAGEPDDDENDVIAFPSLQDCLDRRHHDMWELHTEIWNREEGPFKNHFHKAICAIFNLLPLEARRIVNERIATCLCSKCKNTIEPNIYTPAIWLGPHQTKGDLCEHISESFGIWQQSEISCDRCGGDQQEKSEPGTNHKYMITVQPAETSSFTSLPEDYCSIAGQRCLLVGAVQCVPEIEDSALFWYRSPTSGWKVFQEGVAQPVSSRSMELENFNVFVWAFKPMEPTNLEPEDYQQPESVQHGQQESLPEPGTSEDQMDQRPTTVQNEPKSHSKKPSLVDKARVYIQQAKTDMRKIFHSKLFLVEVMKKAFPELREEQRAKRAIEELIKMTNVVICEDSTPNGLKLEALLERIVKRSAPRLGFGKIRRLLLLDAVEKAMAPHKFEEMPTVDTVHIQKEIASAPKLFADDDIKWIAICGGMRAAVKEEDTHLSIKTFYEMVFNVFQELELARQKRVEDEEVIVVEDEEVVVVDEEVIDNEDEEVIIIEDEDDVIVLD